MSASPGYTPLCSYVIFPVSARPQSASGSSHIVAVTSRRAGCCSGSAAQIELPQAVRNISRLNLFFRTSQPLLKLYRPGLTWRRDVREAYGNGRDSQSCFDCCYDHSVLNAPLAQLAEQRTLNPRVRGSSPWRRTRTDLGFLRSRSFFRCPICPHVGSVLAPESGPGRGGLVQTAAIGCAARK